MAITINNIYKMSSFVYLLSDPESRPRQIIGLQVFADGSHMYRLACGTELTSHHEAELSKTITEEVELFAE